MHDYNERHVRRGIVTNQLGEYDPERPHASTIVCDREECLRKAKFYVQGVTGEPAHHISDKQ